MTRFVLVALLGPTLILADQAPEKAALNDLIAALDAEKDDGKRLILVKKLAALKSPKAIATLSVELSNEKNPNVVRIEAIRGLEALEYAEAQDAIAIAALKAEPPIIRARAIEAIGNLRIREFIPACVRGLASNDARVRRSALDALIQFNDMLSAARALPFVKDADDAVRRSAHRGAGLLTVKLSLFILHRG